MFTYSGCQKLSELKSHETHICNSCVYKDKSHIPIDSPCHDCYACCEDNCEQGGINTGICNWKEKTV